MPLIDLKTDLKSLKYGKDQLGGGNSGQPYIQTDINTIDRGFNRLRFTKFDDGLVRGGAVGAINASVVDTIRIGKFLKDFPKGPLFIVKQVGLQLSNPQLESKKLRTDNPTSGGGLLRNVGNFIINTANKLVNAVGPTRIYNLGINTLAQVPVNAFGIHFNRHGLLPVQNEDTKYINVAEYNNYGDGKNNRLVGYKSKFQLGDNKPNITQNRNLVNTFNSILQAIGTITRVPYNPIKLDPQQLTINRYISGPSSVYGIGNTTIRRYTFTEDGTKINFAKGRNYVSQTVPGVKLYQTFDYAVSNFTSSAFSSDKFNLKQQDNVLSGSLQNIVASKNDPQNSKYVAAAQESSASQRIKSFTAASNYSGSVYAVDAFPDLINNTPSTLINYTASINDPSNSKYIAAAQEASASQRIKSFISLSNYTGSIFSSNRFPNLKAETPPTLNNYIASDVDVVNSFVAWSGALTASNDLGVSNQYFSDSETNIPRPDSATYSNIVRYDIPLTVNGDNISATTEAAVQSRTPVKDASYQKYQEVINSRKLRERTFTDNGNQVNAFGIYGNNTEGVVGAINSGGVLPDATSTPVYSNGQKVVRINIPWNKITREIRVGSGRQDSINLTPLFSASTGTIGDSVTVEGKTFNINDLVKFRIQAIDGDDPSSSNYMIFRAYLTQLSDSTDSSWNEIKYAGRGDKFYIYDGFSRKIQIGFKVAALSEQEMKPMYQKLNYLMSNLMPDYKDGFLMRGPLSKLTVGNWIDGQPGIINSVSYTIPQDSPWEISLGDDKLILPHVVEVSMTFTPIGSQTQDENKISRRSISTSNIAQNYNGKVDGVNYIGG